MLARHAAMPSSTLTSPTCARSGPISAAYEPPRAPAASTSTSDRVEADASNRTRAFLDADRAHSRSSGFASAMRHTARRSDRDRANSGRRRVALPRRRRDVEQQSATHSAFRAVITHHASGREASRACRGDGADQLAFLEPVLLASSRDHVWLFTAAGLGLPRRAGHAAFAAGADAHPLRRCQRVQRCAGSVWR